MDTSFVNLASAGVQQKQQRRQELRENMQKTKVAPVKKSVLSPEQEKMSQEFTAKCLTEDLPVIRSMLKDGASPNVPSKLGDYPVHLIMMRKGINKVDFFKLFFDERHQYEPDINVANKDGQTILHLACIEENVELMEYFLSKGGDPNLQDVNGDSCLHLLAAKPQITTANEKIVAQCLSFGGNIEIQNRQGKLANQLSAHTGHQRLFMQQKIDFDEGVVGGDVEIALSWTNMNDLDVHCECNCGTHIFYSSKVCNNCKGFLDVDENVQPKTNTPVEHIYWPRVSKGHFQFKVVYFRNHPGVPKDTNYLVIMKVKEEVVFEQKGVLTREKEEHTVLTCQFDVNEKFSVLKDGEFKPRSKGKEKPLIPPTQQPQQRIQRQQLPQQMPSQMQQMPSQMQQMPSQMQQLPQQMPPQTRSQMQQPQQMPSQMQ